MLDISLRHQYKLKDLHISTWHQDRYKFYNYQPYWEVPRYDENTWDKHDFVSINGKGEILGEISYSVSRSTRSVYNLNIINFTEDITFGKDVLQAIKDIFEKYHFHKLSFSVVIGNPIEKTYDRLTLKYGGRIVGIEKEETRLFDNKFYDVKRYEILLDDYVGRKSKL